MTKVFDDADRWLRTRLQMPTSLNTEGISRLAPEIRASSFFSARVAQARVLDAIRQVSDRFSRGELDLATARATIKERLGTRYEPGSGKDKDLRNLCSTARLDLVLKQNARMAYAVGEYAQGSDPVSRRLFPAWRYLPSSAAEPRDAHAQYAGRVWLKDDPIWHRIFPPSDFNCRCSVEEVSADEIGAGAAVPEPPTPADALPPAAPSGYAFDPAVPYACNMGALSDDDARRNAMAAIAKKVEESKERVYFRCLPPPPTDGGKRPPAGSLSADPAQLAAFARETGARLNGKGDGQGGRIPKRIAVGSLSEGLMRSLGLDGSGKIVLQCKNDSQGLRHVDPALLEDGTFVATLDRLLSGEGMETGLSVEKGKPLILHVRDPEGAGLLTLRRLANGDWSVVSAHDVSDNRPAEQVVNYLNRQTTTIIQ